MALAVLKLVLVYLWTSQIVSSQSIYIDRDPAYCFLPCCAQTPLSIAVRDMSQGCGDGSALTSYDCFCTTSSSYFSSLISIEVAGQCGNATIALEAISVFNNYCAVGPNGTQSTAGATGSSVVVCSTTSLTSLADSPTNSLAASTSSPTTTAPPAANTSSGSGAKRITGLNCVMLGLLCVMIMVFV